VKVAEFIDKLPFVTLSGDTAVNWVLGILAVLFYVFLAIFVLACLLILWSIFRDMFGVERSKNNYQNRATKIKAKISRLEEQNGRQAEK